MTKKAKYQVGQKYRFAPPPKNRSAGLPCEDSFEVLALDGDRLQFKHLQSGATGFIHFDSIQEYREPGFLMILGQVFIDADKIAFEPGFDPRLIASMAQKAGLGVHILKHEKPQEAEAAAEEEHILKLITGDRTGDAIAELRRILPVAKSELNELQILLALMAWLKEPEHPEVSLDFSSRGIALAKKLKLPLEETVFHSYRALFLSQAWIDEDLKGWYMVQLTNRLGIPTISEEDQKAIIARLKKVEAEQVEEMRLAAKGTDESGSVQLASLYYSHALTICGLKATHLRGVGVEKWKLHKTALKKIFESGKEFLSRQNDDSALGYFYHNAANQLRFLDEKDEALGLATEAQRLGKKSGDVQLERMAGLLIERISQKESSTGSRTEDS